MMNHSRQKASWIARILYSIFTIPVTLQASWEFKMWLLRLRTKSLRHRLAGLRNLKVNLGCGEHGREGWLNFDALPGPGIDHAYDIRHDFPLADESADCIFTEHVVEHLDYYQEFPKFLNECFRALKPGGGIRIIVPDAALYLKGYMEQDWDLLRSIRPLNEHNADVATNYVYKNKMELVNEVFRQGFEHKYAYDFEGLALRLREAGFVDIERMNFNCTRHAGLNIDRVERSGESLYVEATKPAIS
jgi:predicted SAM-dependent methyltransferase